MGMLTVAGKNQHLLAQTGHASSIRLLPQAWTGPLSHGHRHLLQLPFADDSLGVAYLPDDDDDDDSHEHHRHWVRHPEQSLQVEPELALPGYMSSFMCKSKLCQLDVLPSFLVSFDVFLKFCSLALCSSIQNAQENGLNGVRSSINSKFSGTWKF